MCVLLVLITVTNTYSQEQKLGEYDVKAAFIYNFLKFVEWPDKASADTTVNLCVLGNDPFGSAIDSVQGQIVNNKRIVIKRHNDTHALGKCQVLFISRSEKEQLSQILATLTGMNILTVSDTRGFAEQGVIINFYLEENKVRFEVNLDAINRSRLKISSRLLSLAKIVHDSGR